jgi:hypothetical protein
MVLKKIFEKWSKLVVFALYEGAGEKSQNIQFMFLLSKSRKPVYTAQLSSSGWKMLGDYEVLVCKWGVLILLHIRFGWNYFSITVSFALRTTCTCLLMPRKLTWFRNILLFNMTFKIKMFLYSNMHFESAQELILVWGRKYDTLIHVGMRRHYVL